MVLKIPLYLSIEGLEYDDLTLEEFRELQETLSERYTTGINLARSQQFSENFHLEFLDTLFEDFPISSIQYTLKNSKKNSKKKILSTPRLIDREEALAHLRKDLA